MPRAENGALPMPGFLAAGRLLFAPILGCSCQGSERRTITHGQSCSAPEKGSATSQQCLHCCFRDIHVCSLCSLYSQWLEKAQYRDSSI